ncbi:hypothetical protein B0H14DRAFT_3521959 [Mycena olivaceomarginata]|nr:hypothetical protein B0H14DRAFT_3521959 [Mycena olivaceomarginata]
MKRVGSSQLPKTSAKISHFATNVPSAKVTFHTGATVKSQRRYVGNEGLPQAPSSLHPCVTSPTSPPSPTSPSPTQRRRAPGAIPAYETTPACNEKGDAAKAEEICQTIAHMRELKDEETVFLCILMSLHYSSQLNAPCRAALPPVLGKEALNDAHTLGLVLKNGAVRLGHYGEGCPNAEPGRSFTLVERNGIHVTAIAFCGCKTVTAVDGRKVVRSHFEQLLEAGIFPGSIKDPATGYTLGLLQYHQQQRSQGKGSAYNFVLVLQRLANPNFANRVPDIYKNFLAITRFYENIQIIIESGEGHGLDIPLTGEVGRPYPNRPKGVLGLVCTACPEPGASPRARAALSSTFNQPVPEQQFR